MPNGASDAERALTLPIRAASWSARAALALAMLVVFAAHFRPWEVGYMEEWPLAADWMDGGGAFTGDYLSWTLSRPLHLAPTMLGLAITGGAPGGIFLILGLVTALQVPATVWAFRSVTSRAWISGAVGLFLGLHPLWAGGYLQRFLPAQTAALAFVFATGMVIRWLQGGRRRWLVAAFATLLAGFAVYPGPAVVAPLMALVMAIAVQSTWRRRIATVIAVTATSAFMTLYSLVITRLISPSGTSYELDNIEHAAVQGPRQFLALVSATLINQGETVILVALGIAALGALLSLTGAIRPEAGWLMAGAAAASPLMTVVYFGHVGWLQDIDRLSYVMSLALFVALSVWPLSATDRRPRLQRVAAAALVLVSILGTITGIARWQADIALQHTLLNELRPIVADAGDDEEVVVIDRSATYGRMSTFPLQYLASASRVWNQDSTMVTLCFDPPAVPSGGVACDSIDVPDDLRLVTSLPLPSGTVDIYVGDKEPHD